MLLTVITGVVNFVVRSCIQKGLIQEKSPKMNSEVQCTAFIWINIGLRMNATTFGQSFLTFIFKSGVATSLAATIVNVCRRGMNNKVIKDHVGSAITTY